MNVAIRNMITGISEASQDAGRHPGWPNDKVAAAVIEKLANAWTGPEKLPEGHVLTKEAALEIETRLIKAAEHVIKVEGLKPTARAKTASENDLVNRARSAATYWMQKAAEEAGSLSSHGPNTLSDAARTDQLSALEQRQRPEGYAMQQPGGATSLPEAKVTGPRETAPPSTPSVSPPISNSLTEHSQKAAAANPLRKHGAHVPTNDADTIAERAIKAAADEENGGGPPPEGSAGGPPDSPAPPESEGGAQGGDKEDAQMAMLQQIWAVLQQLAPQSDDAAAATAGLAAHGPEGMDVLAHVAHNAKTAAQADAMLSDVLAKNPVLRKIASVEAFQEFKALYKQAGAGSLSSHGSNTLADAAKTDQLSALENKQRPAGYAHHTEPGQTDLPAPAQVGKLMPAPRDGVPPVSAPNVVTKADKQAAAKDEEVFFAQLAKMAQEYGPMIPTTVSENEKVAALCSLIGTPPSQREAVIAKTFAPVR